MVVPLLALPLARLRRPRGGAGGPPAGRERLRRGRRGVPRGANAELAALGGRPGGLLGLGPPGRPPVLDADAVRVLHALEFAKSFAKLTFYGGVAVLAAWGFGGRPRSGCGRSCWSSRSTGGWRSCSTSRCSSGRNFPDPLLPLRVPARGHGVAALRRGQGAQVRVVRLPYRCGQRGGIEDLHVGVAGLRQGLPSALSRRHQRARREGAWGNNEQVARPRARHVEQASAFGPSLALSFFTRASQPGGWHPLSEADLASSTSSQSGTVSTLARALSALSKSRHDRGLEPLGAVYGEDAHDLGVPGPRGRQVGLFACARGMRSARRFAKPRRVRKPRSAA